mmetsp:Transcript_72966/g.101466  ORF Transcript_72966/g.101466 Transcript_72966/m.101466 type:complete len:144 (-) Transcript_72966:79-510(-)
MANCRAPWIFSYPGFDCQPHQMALASLELSQGKMPSRSLFTSPTYRWMSQEHRSFWEGLLKSQQHEAQDDAPNDGKADAHGVWKDLVPEDSTSKSRLCCEQSSAEAEGQTLCGSSLLNGLYCLGGGGLGCDEGGAGEVAQSCQ